METIEIRFNPKKILFRILLCFAFLGVGVWLIRGDTTILNMFKKMSDPNFKKFMGYFIVGLMIVGIAFLIKCLLSKNPGFVIDKFGITDRTSIFSNEIIYWEDIESVEKTALSFFITMPSLKIALKSSNKPRLFSTSLLDITLDELIKITKDNFDKTTANTR